MNTTRRQSIIEYDIVPESNILNEETFKIKLKNIPHLYKKYKLTDCIVRLSDTGTPKVLDEKESHAFETDKAKIVSQRRTDENAKIRRPPSNLRQMLKNLLTAGHTVIEDDIFVVLGPVGDLDHDAIVNNVTFLKDLHPEVVFDFDGKGSSNGICQSLEDDENMVTRILTVDDFKAKRNGIKEIDELASNLGKEKHTCWIFCNGYDKLEILPLQSTEWNKNKRNAFAEALRSFLKIVHNENVLVLICLFGTNNEVVLEASEVIFSALPNQWVLLAENDKAANVWRQTLLDRKKIDKSDAGNRCVIGMAWHQVNQCISDWCNNDKVLNVQIPRSDGTHVNVAEKTITKWTDIEVVSCSDPVFEDPNGEKFKQKEKKLEEEFYRGAQVNWLNFWFHDQVLVREVHDNLTDNVVSALEMHRKDEEMKMIHVYLHHQPGAGGTTSAKQVLWSLRKKYRCCVVNDITDQTCIQLRDFYSYNDMHPKPILILLDNADDEKIESLQVDLDQITHDLQTEMQEDLNVFCVLFICERCPDVSPAKRKNKMIFLRHELHPKELDWFSKKSKELETRFSKDGNDNINPKFLISFNILKENFDPNYITKVVKEFTTQISSEVELRLLKYVSLINAHDVYFTVIPVACITRILQTAVEAQGCYHLKANKWEENMSQGLKLLLNVATKKRRHIPKAVRIFHKLIAIEILKQMKRLSEQSESEIMHELLEYVFDDEDRDSKEMQRIVTNVIRKRPLKADKLRREQFSSVILSVMKNEGKEKAIAILKNLHSFDNDPFTAQQIARSYMEMKNFPEAEAYARSATEKLPDNSFLWDTYGQVYKNQLQDKVDYQKSLVNKSEFTQHDVTEAFQFYHKAVQYFKIEQIKSEDEMNAPQGKDNLAGHFNELRCILLLLNCLENCCIFASREDLHEYLVSEKTPNLQMSLTSDQTKCIKNLYPSSKQTIQRLEEESIQRKNKFSSDMFAPLEEEEESLIRDFMFLKRSLDDYFGETSDNVKHIFQNKRQLCEYNYRKAYTKGAPSLQLLLKHTRSGGSTKFFIDLYNLLFPTVDSPFCCSEYLKAILNTVVMLCLTDQIADLSFSDILTWSYKLYTASDDNETNPLLEKYLFFILFHFPTEERKAYAIYSSFELNRAISQWESAYDKKYHKNGKKSGVRRKETTLFFLGRGQPLEDLVYQEELSTFMRSHSRTQKWYLPDVLKVLRPMSGILLEGGHKIKYYFETKHGNREFLTIRTSIPVRQHHWYQRKVYFFVGFSFSGPKAYGVSDEIRNESSEERPREPVARKSHVNSKHQRNYKKK